MRCSWTTTLLAVPAVLAAAAPALAVPPKTTITSGPSGPTNADYVEIRFVVDQPAVEICWRLVPRDPGLLCGGGGNAGIGYVRLEEGAYEFQVRARNAAGEVDPTPATRSFTIDRTPPDTTIDGPAGLTAATSHRVTLGPSDGTLTCRLDTPRATGTFAPCTSPFTWALAAGDGEYTLHVLAVDAAGNVDPTPETRTVTLDTQPPETTLVSRPGVATNTERVEFEFAAPGAERFECRYDTPIVQSQYGECTSPHMRSTFVPGTYAFHVRGIDAAGNVDPTPASHTFTVERDPPDTTITSAPPTLTRTDGPTFTFSSTEAGSTFECMLEGPGPLGNGTLTPCSSPVTHPDLEDGPYRFVVRATDPAGNPDPEVAAHIFTLDTADPDTTLLAGPAGPTANTSVTFTFASSETGSTFRCRLDGRGVGTFAPCSSPHSYAGLEDGFHVFHVQAVDRAGNVDAVAATRSFTVDTEVPPPQIVGPAEGSTHSSRTVAIRGTAEPEAAVTVLEDGVIRGTTTANRSGNWVLELSNVQDGPHRYAARARDLAGNVSVLSEERRVRVDASPPSAPLIMLPVEGLALRVSSVSVQGFAEPLSKVEVRNGASVLGSTTAAPTGRWELPATTFADGGHTLTATATDAVGHVSAASPPRAFTVDTVAPETTVDGPSGRTADTTPAFTFAASEDGATFACRLDGPAGEGKEERCTSPLELGPLADGRWVLRVRAMDRAGNPDESAVLREFVVDTKAPPPPVDPAVAAPPASAGAPGPAAPRPVFGKSVLVTPVRGAVLVRAAGARRFTRLAAATLLPFGSRLDARRGTVELASVLRPAAAPQRARFSGGVFGVRDGAPTELRLTGRVAPCRAAKRRLWSDGAGSFAVRGSYATATGASARWLVEDGCAGTLVRVGRGSVTVHDRPHRRTVKLRAGRRLLVAHGR